MSERAIFNKRLDRRGRCCGRKPLVYRRPPHLFCVRCDAGFDPDTGNQIANWAYEPLNGGFASTRGAIA